ncbi:glycosyltransferase [Haladaptatus caseinilyticus]|uniref:glycosyltransferase n=1 Tax=Haladaptatus caseinilyticus TaxID=2993314 RepID=UPI00224A9F1D|nr:glycosyltransferase [Haladaptatus caseinilyticus]
MFADIDDQLRSLRGRTVWMINSAEQGGGVAEMMPQLITLLREIGIQTQWIVIESDDPTFFDFTKRIHNLLHGVGVPEISAEEISCYERESRHIADSIQRCLGPDDIVVCHDPQPLAAGALAVAETGVPSIWCSHIGRDEITPQTKAGWEYLRPWIREYDRTVFSLPEYIPEFLRAKTVCISPAIDPLSPKNKSLAPQELLSLLVNSALVEMSRAITNSPLDRDQPVQRLQPDGSLEPAIIPDDFGILSRPFVLQISRWDRLKGLSPLLRAFVHLKKQNEENTNSNDYKKIASTGLVLAGPSIRSVADDPEGQLVFDELCQEWQRVPPELKRDIALLVMPEDNHDSALVVNALQRCATVVVQNSLQEGFGLTVTEAMWKGALTVGADRGGIRAQICDNENGKLIPDPEAPAEVASVLKTVLTESDEEGVWTHNAQENVRNEYLIFQQARRWIAILDAVGRSHRQNLER